MADILVLAAGSPVFVVDNLVVAGILEVGILVGGSLVGGNLDRGSLVAEGTQVGTVGFLLVELNFPTTNTVESQLRLAQRSFQKHSLPVPTSLTEENIK